VAKHCKTGFSILNIYWFVLVSSHKKLSCLVVGSLLAHSEGNLSSFCSWSVFACSSWVIWSPSLSTLLLTIFTPSSFCSSFQLIFMGFFLSSLKIYLIGLAILFAACCFPFLFSWRPCLVKWCLSEVILL